jgi:hypothetical protein
MAKTLEDARNMLRSFLDEPIAADWTDPELNALLNARYHLLYTAVVDVFEEYAELKQATTDLVAGQQEYETQLDFLKMRRVEVKYKDDATSYARALPISLDQVRRDLADVTGGVTVVRQPNYYLRGNIIGLLPVPTLDVVDGIKSWYYATVPDLVANSDTFRLPYADRDWLTIVYGAAADALMFGQQEPAASDQMEKRWKQGLEIMQQSLEDRVSDEYKGVVNVVGDDDNFAEWNY